MQFLLTGHMENWVIVASSQILTFNGPQVSLSNRTITLSFIGKQMNIKM